MLGQLRVAQELAIAKMFVSQEVEISVSENAMLNFGKEKASFGPKEDFRKKILQILNCVQNYLRTKSI